MTSEKLTDAALAKRLGKHRGYINKLRRGLCLPGCQLILLIDRESGGRVGRSDWEAPARQYYKIFAHAGQIAPAAAAERPQTPAICEVVS